MHCLRCRLCATAFFSILPAFGCAPHFNGPQLIQHIAYLASDDLAGRAVGTPGIEQAAEYIAWQFQQAGLQPRGENGTYFQSFEITLGQEMLGRPSLSVAGAPALGQVRRDFVPFPFSSSESFEGPVAFAGYGISNEDEKYDDYAGFDATGKVLLMFRYEPHATDPKAKFGAQSPSQHASFMNKAVLARNKGAKAILIVNPPMYHGKEDRLFAFDSVDFAGRYGIPMMHVTRDYAGRLLKAAGVDDLTKLQQDLDQRKRRSMDLKGLVARGDPGLVKRKIKTRNVIAELRGEGPDADEYVVVGAHYDHVGRVVPHKPSTSKPAGADQTEIHNGADDNASGTSGVIELARAFAQRGSPGRSMLFMAFSGEEEGLLGSAHYANHPTVPMEKTVTMVNLDMIGRLRAQHLEVYGTDTGNGFERLVKYHAGLLGLKLKITGAGEGPSDMTAFCQKQVPVLFFFTGMHKDYHGPGDDVEKINGDGEARVVQLAYGVLESVAAAPGRPAVPVLAQKDEKSRKEGKPREERTPQPRAGLKVRLGVMPSYAADDKPGLLIQGAAEGSPAERAGLHEGDRILKVGQTEVNNVYDLMQALKDYSPGDEAKVLAMRGKERVELGVKFEASAARDEEKSKKD